MSKKMISFIISGLALLMLASCGTGVFVYEPIGNVTPSEDTNTNNSTRSGSPGMRFPNEGYTAGTSEWDYPIESTMDTTIAGESRWEYHSVAPAPQPEYHSITPEALTSPAPLSIRPLGIFTTKFNPGSKNRAANIHLASSKIHNTIIHPGEEFSFNTMLGPTNEANGYEIATVFVDGREEESFGGGVCQVSSTLYNAAAAAGMTITEHHNHSLPVHYVEEGKDAATSYGGKDFKFRNDLPHPISIYSEASGEGSLKVSIVLIPG